jgi:magnesium transporter
MYGPPTKGGGVSVSPPAYNRAMIVDNVVYVDGRRSAPCAPEQTRQACRERGGFAWVGLSEPTGEEFDSVAGEFGLRDLAVKDAIKAHQRPKVERYEDTLFVVLKAARYVEETEAVEFGEIHASWDRTLSSRSATEGAPS